MLGHKISDVYVLTYLPTGKKYVGRSTNVENRIQLHMCLLRHGKHNSKELQQDYNRYGGGKDAFSVETVGKYRHDRCSDVISQSALPPIRSMNWRTNSMSDGLTFLAASKSTLYSGFSFRKLAKIFTSASS